MTHLADRTALLETVTEKEWMQQVRTWAVRNQWMVYHTHDSRRSESGFPDLLLVRHGRAIAAELKSVRGRQSPAQKAWLHALEECGIEAYCWRPTDERAVRERLEKRD